MQFNEMLCYCLNAQIELKIQEKNMHTMNGGFQFVWMNCMFSDDDDYKQLFSSNALQCAIDMKLSLY